MSESELTEPRGSGETEVSGGSTEVMEKPTGYVACPLCDEVVKTQGKHAHWLNNHSDIDYNEYKDDWRIAPAEEEREGEGEEEEEVLPPDVEARKFVVKELRKRLRSVYGIGSKKVNGIANTVRDNPQIALNPTALYWHIKQLARKANNYQLYLFISGLFNKMREEGLLAGIQQPWPVMGMPGAQMQQQQPIFPFMFSQNQKGQSQQPFFNPFMPQQQQQQFRTPEEFEEWSDRRARATRRMQQEEEEHELRMAKLRKEIESMNKPRRSSSDVVEIVEPMRDAEGNLMRDEEGNIIFRKIRGPSDKVQRATGEDSEMRFLNKAKRYQEIFTPKTEGVPEEKVRSIIKESQSSAKPLTEKDVQEAAQEAALSVVAATREKDEEERRHKELLSAIERSGRAKTVEGYKTDTYRFMGQGMDRLASVIEKKEPVKLVVDLVRETPPEKRVETGAREGIFKRVAPEFVAEE